MSAQVETVYSITSPSPTDDYGSGRDKAPPRSYKPTSSLVAAAPAAARQPSPQDVEDAIKRINEHLAESDRVIDLQVDAKTGLTVVTVRNSKTGEALQQYPAEDSIHLAQMLAGWSQGGNVLLDLIA